MTPLGHFSASYISGSAVRHVSLTGAVIGGMLPDADFVFLLFEWFNQAHRVVTHNILFITLASVIGFIIAFRGRKAAVGAGMLLGGILHLIIDSCMDNNPTNGIGIALFWPLSDMFISPFNLLGLRESSDGWNDPAGMIKSLVPSMLYEVPLYAVSAYIFIRRTGRTRSCSRE